METKNTTTITWIATLRGFLVLCVFISHFVYVIDEKALFVIGKMGVAGFFLISGYLAVNSIKQRSTKQFLFNRFIRLYPVYWLLILLTFVVDLLTQRHSWNLKELLANLTFFHQYLGINSMIGTSWMLSIMVVFFVTIAFFGRKEKMSFFMFFLFLIAALISSLLRYHYRLPFPTAIFLMSCVGFLGFFYCKYGVCKKLICLTFLYEVVLLIASYLSYQSMLMYYLLAYNGAFVLFLLFERLNFNGFVLKRVGEQGFTFFLGAGLPLNLLIYFFPNLKYNFLIFLTIHFSLCFLFSFIVTRFIEKPIICHAKKIEYAMAPAEK